MSRENLWRIDPAHSSVEFTVKHMMFTTVRGRFRKFRGTILIDEARPERSFVEVEIDAISIDTNHDERDLHLRSEDFLHVDEHPTITFRSRRILGAPDEEGDPFRIVGDLTLRGETIEVDLDAVFEGTGRDPAGRTRAAFRARTELDRRDWGLMWNQALETGGVLVANRVRINIDVQAVKVSREGQERAA